VEKLVDSYIRGVSYFEELKEDQSIEDLHIFKFEEVTIDAQLLE